MRLTIGDKVRFLNEAIEGVVSKILSNGRVEITTPEGFLQSASEQQLVKVEFTMEDKVVEETELREVRNHTEPNVKQGWAVEPKPKNEFRPPVIPSLKNDETIYAAVVLKDERSPLVSSPRQRAPTSRDGRHDASR